MVFMFAAWFFLVTLWLPDVMQFDQDRSFELIRAVPAPNGELIKVYRTNGGAMTSYGVVIRKEIKILPGIYLTTVIGSKYHQSDAEVSINPNGSVKINYDVSSHETTF